jgi:hypothetical protein
MGKSFLTICRELADSILEYTGYFPGSVLGQWGQQGMHTFNAAPEGI